MIGGTTQDRRLPSALDPGRIGVDESTLASRIAQCMAHAATLRFVALDGREAGHWHEAFSADPTVQLALVASAPLQRVEAAFLADIDGAPLLTVAEQVLARIEQLNDWQRALLALVAEPPAPASTAERSQGGPTAETAEQTAAEQAELLLAAVERVAAEAAAQTAPEVQAVLARLAGSALAARVAALRRALGPAGSAIGASVGPVRPLRDALRASFFAVVGAQRRVQHAAAAALPASLRRRPHDSATALLLAFLQAYEQVQHHVNRFSDRLIDFYYRRCLGLAPAVAEGGAVHLVLARTPGRGEALEVPAGTRFATARAGTGVRQVASSEPMALSDARVVALRTLRLTRDPDIAPERAFEHVTQVRCCSHRLDGRSGQQPSPLFGGSLRESRVASERADVGLAVASELLRLAEGERRIELSLEFDLAELEAAMPLFQALAAGHSAAERRRAVHELRRQRAVRALWPYRHRPDLLRAALGRVFALWLVATRLEWPVLVRRRLRRVAARRLGNDDAALRHRLLPGRARRRSLAEQRQLRFDELLGRPFVATLSTAVGWTRLADARVEADGERSGRARLRLSWHLKPGAPAVVPCDDDRHGADWAARSGGAPMLRLHADEDARLHPYSLFEALPLHAVAIEVAVEGLRGFEAHNQLGRLDPGKPFLPFGPLPAVGNYWVIGAPELSAKPLTGLTVSIGWGALPAGQGGFAAHYRGYGPGWSNDAFQIETTVLRDAGWRMAAPQAARHRLFDSAEDGTLLARQDVPVDPQALQVHWRTDTAATGFDQGARSGHVRLQLVGPPSAFGHARHPQLLTEVVTANARRRRKPLPMPLAPYTPIVERCSLSYRARRRIVLGRVDSGVADGDRLLHLHPFGIETVHGGGRSRAAGVLPRLGPDGQLLIGIAAGSLAGELSLLFVLQEDAAVERKVRMSPRREVSWAVLGATGWVALPPWRVLSDSTRTFLRSGIVRLELPDDACTDNPMMPTGLYWLRVGTHEPSERFAALVAVHAQAVEARPLGDGDAATAALPAQAVREPAVRLPGLAGVEQPMAGFGDRRAEDEPRFRTRVAESLRHRGRASLPWDVERLVLERFAQVWKVRCFPHLQSPEGRRAPGRLLVVVVPTAPRQDPQQLARAARLNANDLREIEEFLRPLASPLASIQVRNAAYERVQLRCTLRLDRSAQPGLVLQAVTRSVNEFLSPWHDAGPGSDFDWSLRGEDLENCIRAHPKVRAVTRLSMLHLGESEQADERWWLADTARARDAAAVLRPHAPWSLLLPTASHLIDLADGAAIDDAPRVTGVSRLAVGGTFVVGGGPRKVPA